MSATLIFMPMYAVQRAAAVEHCKVASAAQVQDTGLSQQSVKRTLLWGVR